MTVITITVVVIITMAEVETDTVKPMDLVRVAIPLQPGSQAPALPHTASLLMSEVSPTIHQLCSSTCFPTLPYPLYDFPAIVQLAKQPCSQCVEDTEVQGRYSTC